MARLGQATLPRMPVRLRVLVQARLLSSAAERLPAGGDTFPCGGYHSYGSFLQHEKLCRLQIRYGAKALEQVLVRFQATLFV